MADNEANELLGVSPEWFLQVLKASQTGILPEAELARMRKLMPDNEYLQEFECDFDAAITGAYYAKELADARAALKKLEAERDLLAREVRDRACWREVRCEVQLDHSTGLAYTIRLDTGEVIDGEADEQFGFTGVPEGEG